MIPEKTILLFEDEALIAAHTGNFRNRVTRHVIINGITGRKRTESRMRQIDGTVRIERCNGLGYVIEFQVPNAGT